MEENNNNEQTIQESDIENEIKYLKKQWLYKTIAIVVILGCIIGVASSAFTYYFTIKKKNDKFVASTYDLKEGTTTTATGAIGDVTPTLTAFAEMIDELYIGEIDKKELVTETIKGFIKGIGDEYSEYMTAEEWQQYQEDSFGNYFGVGIAMMEDKEKGYILVANVIKDSPAERAGIKTGDFIIGVNGESIYQMSNSDVANKVRGEEGTEVTLNILRNESETLEFKLTREKIREYHVEGKMLENDIGYVSLFTFDEGCAEEFEKVVDDLVAQGTKKLILDLRLNTGGDVSQALQILDLFLEKGQIELITKSATGPEITTSSATDKKYSFDNILILTNEYTASASEILIGALKDNGLAKTVGTKTYGKGVMQSVIQLLDGSILKVTTQEYKTPNGTKIHGVGIEPDYEVELDTESEVDNQLEKAKELLK